MEPKEFEAWGRAVAEHSAALIVAEIPAAQLPEPGKTVRAVLGRRGYITRYVHFRRPDQPVQRAVWLFAVPPAPPSRSGGGCVFLPCRPAIPTTSRPRTTASAPACCRTRIRSSAPAA